jgi:hypothetical protein
MRSVLVIVLVAAVLALLAGVAYFVAVPGASDFFAPTETITDTELLEGVAIAFVQTPFLNDYANVRVPGWVDNVSGSKIRSVTLEARLIDQDGNRREQITHVVYELDAGTRRSFDINAGTIAGPRTAEISVVEAVVLR